MYVVNTAIHQVSLSLTKNLVAVEQVSVTSVACFRYKIKHCVLYTATTFFVNEEEKLNNGYTITSLKLYIPKLPCISC